MRAVPLLLGLAASCASCSDEKGGAPELAQGDEMIACQVGGASAMRRACAVDRVLSGDTLMLVVRHPDGAFRRFAVQRDGTGVAPADGAQQGLSRLDGDILELTLGSDIYRFPATKVSHAEAP
ncbi:MAG: hypothetical protein KUG65_06125 [Sphingomonadaceae bacterium]|nr:hypothetical protein [Sphingomonadaceae bacterium]